MSAFPFRVYQDFLDYTLQNPTSIQVISKHNFPQGGSATLLDVGVLLCEPDTTNKETQDLVISAGVHGNETGPIELVNSLIQKLFAGELQLKNRVLFILGNPPAMNIAKRFTVENMNRLFGPNNNENCYEAVRAKQLMKWVKQFYLNGNSERLHYDLHTAIRGSQFEKFALFPFIPNRKPSEKQLSFLQESGVDTVLLNSSPAQTFSHFTSEYMGAESFTIELGAVRPFGQNQDVNLTKIELTLRNLIEGNGYGKETLIKDQVNLFKVADEVIRHTDGFEFHIDDDVKNFTGFDKGFLVAEDKDYRYEVQHEKEYLIFPNKNVQNGHRAAVMLIKEAI